MIGILLVSHGEMANGLLNSCRMFFGDTIPQMETVCLMEGDSPEEFDLKLKKAVLRLNDGTGIMIFCDLIGGTPSNRCLRVINERLRCIVGMNLAVLIEFLSIRDMLRDISEVDIEELLETGKNSIIYLNNVAEKIKSRQEEKNAEKL